MRTSSFEGPFDLLLHLVLREEVDLWEVSLAGLVDAFVAELRAVGPIDLDAATEFLVIAATLVELKTRRLLPGPDTVELDEELAGYEERDLVLARLLECRTFQAAAAALARRAEAAARSRPRCVGLEEPFLSLAPDLLAGVTPPDLRAAYLRATPPRPVPTVDLGHVAPIRVSVAETAQQLAGVLPALGRVPFRRLTRGLERLEVIVRFLALLELYKNGLVDLEQASTFGDLVVSWTGGDARPAAAGAALGEAAGG